MNRKPNFITSLDNYASTGIRNVGRRTLELTDIANIHALRAANRRETRQLFRSVLQILQT
jgi:hypothetical protein